MTYLLMWFTPKGDLVWNHYMSADSDQAAIAEITAEPVAGPNGQPIKQELYRRDGTKVYEG